MATLFANGTAVGGITFVTVAGLPLMAVSDVHYQGRLFHREDAKGMDGIHGFTETIDVPLIKGKFRVPHKGMDVAALQSAVGIPVILETNAGYSLAGNNGWAHEIGEVDTTNGEFDGEWHFPQALTISAIADFNFVA
jgi:hypothetical protein